MKENPMSLYERDGVTYYAVIGNNGKDRAARQCYRCGGKPSTAKVTDIDRISGKELSCNSVVVCDNCGFVVPEGNSRDSAVVAWNRENYKQANRPKWMPYAVITAGAIALTAINVATIFVH